MGKSFYYKGHFTLNKVLKPEHKAYLQRYARISHKPLHVELLHDIPDPLRELVGLSLGPQGMYFVGQIDESGLGDDGLLDSFVSPEPSQRFMWPFKHERHLMLARFWMNVPAWYYPDFVPQHEHEYTRDELELRFRPALFPSRDCYWTPTNDGRGIECIQHDKTDYALIRWLYFLQLHFFDPWGYELTGEVHYYDTEGSGKIVAKDHEFEDIDLTWEPKPEKPEGTGYYWSTYEAISEHVMTVLKQTDVIVRTLSHEPSVILVGLPYDLQVEDDLSWEVVTTVVHSRGIELYTDRALGMRVPHSNVQGKCLRLWEEVAQRFEDNIDENTHPF